MQRREVLAGVAAMSIASTASWTKAAPNGVGLTGYIRTNWSQDPFSFGSYSYVAKGTGPAEYAALEAPIGDKVFFAGEATHPELNSTVHAAYLSGQRVAKAVLQTNARKIAIVGAGMSGLSAAHALAGEGREVAVFEARDRIGGRVWTDDRLGFPADLGAAWIHGVRGNPLTALSDAHRIERQRTQNTAAGRGGDGRKINWSSLPSRMTDEDEIQVAFGADKAWIEPAGITETDGFDGHDVSFPGGYSQIFEALRGGYSTELSCAVTAVDYSGGKVRISFESRESRAFDAVVVTVPLGVLKTQTIVFHPALPEPKRSAISRMGMGLLDKLYLKFEDVFWDKDATWILTPESGLPRGHFGQWFNLGRYIDEPVIVALNGGSAALTLAQEQDQALVDQAVQVLRRAYPSSA